MAEEIQVIVNDTQEEVSIYVGTPSDGVQSVTGDGVDNTDPNNPILTFPTLDEVLTEGNSSNLDINLGVGSLNFSGGGNFSKAAYNEVSVYTASLKASLNNAGLTAYKPLDLTKATKYNYDAIRRQDGIKALYFPPFLTSTSGSLQSETIATENFAKARANHTGTQLASTISDFLLAVIAASIPSTHTGTVIPLNNPMGSANNTATWNATYTLGAMVAGGTAIDIIDTTGQTVFPAITGATLLTGSAFEATKIYEMHTYTTDGTNAFYYFLIRE